MLLLLLRNMMTTMMRMLYGITIITKYVSNGLHLVLTRRSYSQPSTMLPFEISHVILAIVVTTLTKRVGSKMLTGMHSNES